MCVCMRMRVCVWACVWVRCTNGLQISSFIHLIFCYSLFECHNLSLAHTHHRSYGGWQTVSVAPNCGLNLSLVPHFLFSSHSLFSLYPFLYLIFNRLFSCFSLLLHFSEAESVLLPSRLTHKKEIALGFWCLTMYIVEKYEKDKDRESTACQES